MTLTLSLQDLGLPSEAMVWHAVLLTVISFGVGIVGGFVGLALGTVRLPVLLFLGMPSTLAAGTNIIVSTASSLFGALRHMREGRVDLRVVLIMGVPSFGGAFLGGYYAGAAPEGLLILVVGVLVLWQGIELVGKARAAARSPGGPEKAAMADAMAGARGRRRHPGLAAAMGLVIGVTGGAVGLILGSLRLPGLIRVLGMDPRIAAGTNLFIGFAMGASGWTAHVARGQVDYPLAVLMGAAAVAGVNIGARQTGRAGLGTLLASMGAVLIVVGALMAWRGVDGWLLR